MPEAKQLNPSAFSGAAYSIPGFNVFPVQSKFAKSVYFSIDLAKYKNKTHGCFLAGMLLYFIITRQMFEWVVLLS